MPDLFDLGDPIVETKNRPKDIFDLGDPVPSTNKTQNISSNKEDLFSLGTPLNRRVVKDKNTGQIRDATDNDDKKEVFDVDSFDKFLEKDQEPFDTRQFMFDTAGSVKELGKSLGRGLKKSTYDAVKRLDKETPTERAKQLAKETGKAALNLTEGTLANIDFLKEAGSNLISQGIDKAGRVSRSLQGIDSEESALEERKREYERDVERQVLAQRRGSGKTITGDIVEKLGGKELREKSGVDETIDQDVANLLSLATDPLILVSGGAGAITRGVKNYRRLKQLGRLEEAERIADAVKQAESALKKEKVIDEGADLLNTPDEITKVDETLYPTAKEAVEDLSKEYSTADEFIKDNVKSDSAIKRTASTLKKVIENPAASAVDLAGSTAEIAGNIAKSGSKLLDRIGPVGRAGLRGIGGAALGNLATENVAGTLIGAAGGVLAGKRFKNLEEDNLTRMADNIQAAGKSSSEILKGTAKAMRAGGGKEAFFKAATETSSPVARETLTKAAGIDLLEDSTPLGTGILSRVSKGIANTGELANKVGKGAVYGGALGYAVNPTQEGAASGVGGGLFYSPLIAGAESSWSAIRGYSPESRNRYAEATLKEKSPEEQKVLRESPAIQNNPLALARLFEIEDLAKGFGQRDTTWKYLSDGQWANEYNKFSSENNVLDDTRTPNGVFIARNKVDGKPVVLINADKAPLSATPHEAVHVIDSLTAYEGTDKKGDVIGNDLTSLGKIRFNESVLGSKREDGSVIRPGAYTDEQLAGLMKQYQSYFDTPQTGLFDETGKLTPPGQERILNELSADAGMQFAERAGDGGVLKYAQKVIRMSDDRLASLLSQNPRSDIKANNYVRNRGESALFRDEEGKPIINSPEMERATAEKFLAKAGVTKEMSLGEVDTIERISTQKELVDDAQEAITDLKKSFKIGNPEDIKISLKKVNDLIETGLYRTRARQQGEIFKDAFDLTKFETGKNKVTKEEVEQRLPLIPKEEFVSEGNLKLGIKERPIVKPLSEQNKIDKKTSESLNRVLDRTSIDDAESGLKKAENGTYYGRKFSDEQLSEIIDQSDIPVGVKRNIEILNSNINGTPLEAWYYKVFGGSKSKNKGNIARQLRRFSVISFNFSKAANALAIVLDRTNLAKAAKKEAANPESQVMGLFRQADDVSDINAYDRFDDSVQKVLENYATGKEGHIGLDANEALAKEKRDAIVGFLGIKNESGRPNIYETENRFIKSFRIDRMYDISRAEGERPYTLTFGQKPEKQLLMPDTKPANEAGANVNQIEDAKKQWKEKGVESPYFKKWFGSSKVVDANGKPLVVYHGTGENGLKRNIFDKSLLGSVTKSKSAKSGFFFVTDKDTARGYSQFANLKPVEDLVQKSYKAERLGQWDLANELMAKAEKLEQDYSPKEHIVEAYLFIKNPYEFNAENERFLDVEDQIHNAIEQAKVNGHDGVVLRNLIDNAGWGSDRTADHWIVFEPNQIKSAKNNRGTFELNNPDIRFMPDTSPQEEAPRFYSRLQRAIEGIKQDKLSLDQVRAAIGKNVDQQEVIWTGLDLLLDEKQNEGVKSVTKSELIDFVDKNQINLEEVPYTASHNSPLFPEQTLPGGENYREIVLTLPQYQNEPFKSSHYPDVPNYLAHIRVNDRTDGKGKKMLFLEEVQSDLHQKARKTGYGEQDIFEVYNENTGEVVDTVYNQRNASYLMASVPWYYYRKVGKGVAVPETPFKGEGWKKLALRRAIAMAAEEGFDSIGWTTGRQQIDRYDLSHHVDKIAVHKDAGEDMVTIIAYKKGKAILGDTLYYEDLPIIVGEEMADKIKKQKEFDKAYHGEELKIYYPGISRFYDKELVNMANDIAGKFGKGNRVKPVKIADKTFVHSLEITPEIKKSVLEGGQPLFMPDTGTLSTLKLDESPQNKSLKNIDLSSDESTKKEQ